MPEPVFTKAFATWLTVRLALIVGVLELRNIAMPCLELYEGARAARSLKELEAVAERFGRALGGTALRVLVTVASLGVARTLPNVPPGGLGPLLGPPRFAPAGGFSFQSAASAHVVSDSTIVIAGVILGTAGAAAGTVCADGSRKQSGFQWHQLATNRSLSSRALQEAQGGHEKLPPSSCLQESAGGRTHADSERSMHAGLSPSSDPHQALSH